MRYFCRLIINDDAELFAAFSCLRYRPDVVVCLRSYVEEARYGVTAETREAETAAALEILGCSWEQWPYRDDRPIPGDFFDLLMTRRDDYDRVFAPAVEDGGHEHHSKIGQVAEAVFGDRVVSYLTYTRHGGRSRDGVEVVPEPGWIAKKSRALACYRSQIALPDMAPHFVGELREWYAP